MPSTELLWSEFKHLTDRVTRHKDDADRDLDALEARVLVQENFKTEINLWRAKILGAVLVLTPASGILTAIVIHVIEKALKG